jgi:16S rRNA (guanine966-N2)-methyltransferase
MRIIAGQFKNRPLVAPKGDATRPTSNMMREALFNICQHYIQESTFLDLFAGSGALGLEALSRGASTSTFIESQREAIRCIQKNVEALQVQDKCTIFQTDVFIGLKRLEKGKKTYDIIFADPPYEIKDLREKILRTIDEGSLLKEGGFFFIEEADKASKEMLPLKTLELISSRRLGRSLLQQYRKFK